MFLEGVAPYALTPNEKERFLKAQLEELLVHHEQKCAPYARVVQDCKLWRNGQSMHLEDYPFLPVSVFKEYDLKSTSTA